MASKKNLVQTAPEMTRIAAMDKASLNLRLFIMKFLIKPLLVVMLVILSVGSVLALPPAVELDRLMLHAKKALDAKSYNEAADKLAQAQKLGIAMPESFALRYATALAGLGKANEAKSVLDKYFSKYGTKGSSYKEVLGLLVQIEDQMLAKSEISIQSVPAAEVVTITAAAEQDLSTTNGAGKINKRAPARPQIPITVSGDIWRDLEASEAYLNFPQPKTFKISYQTSAQAEYTGKKNSSLPRPASTSINAIIEETPLSNKCSMQRSSVSLNGKTSLTESYLCGVISLGSKFDGKTTSFIKSLDELKGSLFPMRIGNMMSIRYQSAYAPDRRFDYTIASSCQVMSKAPASELDIKLEGNAWKIHCQSSYTSDYDKKPKLSENDDYYLENLKLKVSAIGQLNFHEKKFFFPKSGDQTLLVTEGDYSSRNTTTYISYDWSVSNKDLVMDRSIPLVQSASAAETNSKWGLSDQDLSIMVGPELMKKVYMTERRADILVSAQAGNMVAQYLIGASYAYGIGTEKDDVQKVFWITKSAEQGLVRARVALAEARIRGVGTQQDDISGWTLLLESSKSGNGIAQYLAAIYTLSGIDNGDGRTRQYSFLEKNNALALLRRSAEAGVAPSQYALGHSYLQGTEFNDKDLKLARYWLQMAAAQHLPQAVAELENLTQNN